MKTHTSRVLCSRSCLLTALGVGLITGHAQSLTAVSSTAGLHKITLTAGANFISTPLHPQSTYAGGIVSSTANSVTFAGNPGFSVNQFAFQSAIAQYILIVANDASSPGTGVTGDWWHITANTANSVTVSNGSDNLATHLAQGDRLEVRRLTSVKDIFGSGATLVTGFNKDNDEDPITSQEDVIRLVQGTTFAGTIYYHDGSSVDEGWYLGGNLIGNGDGSLITFNPGQPFVFFRKVGSANLQVALTGQVQGARLTRYLSTGANAVGSVFPVNAPVGTSNLKESGWVSDNDEDPISAQEDVGRSVVGTTFSTTFYHHDGSSTDAGWYAGGVLNNAFPFEPGKGAILFRKTTAGALVWRQAPPFVN